MHDRDGAHWHKPHHKILHNPGKDAMRLWRDELSVVAKTRLLGVNVINCTPGSALTCFPIMSLNEALNGNVAVESGADPSGHCGVA